MGEVPGPGQGGSAREPRSTPGEQLIHAIREHRVVALTYNGVRRTVEPHMVALHEAGEAVLYGYQIGGPSLRGEVPGWRTFILTEITDVEPLDRYFSGPRRDFRPEEQRLIEVFARA